MELKGGDWVRMQDGRVARVVEVDRASQVVLAERHPDGAVVDRPVAYVNLNWTRLSPEGLLVRRTVDPASLASVASAHPADVLVAALVDAGGEATSEQLRARIVPDPVAEDAWERWWKRLQPKLEKDPRVDTSRAREKRYRLLRDGERQVDRLRPALQQEVRLGRILADAPQLREARRVARETTSRSPEETELIRREVAIATNPEVDPTDRFMAAELGVWTHTLNEDEARHLLGTDALAIDLLRVPQKESKDRALGWALNELREQPELTQANLTTLASAAAVGDPWSQRARHAVADSNVAARRVAEGFLGWAVPGAEETGPAKFPDDLEALERRIDRARQALPGLTPNEAAGFFLGALRALDLLPDANTHAQYRERVLADLARLAWQARRQAGPAAAPRLDERGDLRAEALRLLIDASSRDDLPGLEPGVRAAFRRRPNEYASTFELLARRNGRDPAAQALEVARDTATSSGVRLVALHAFAWAASNNSPVLSEIASLAGTVAPDDPAVKHRLDQMAAAHATAALEGEVLPGAAWFSGPSWSKFLGTVLQRIDDALTREQKAEAEQRRLADEAASLRSAASQLSESLRSSREETGTAGREATQRLASNLLKPVALAVADSYEAASLEALRESLLAVLARARLRPIGAVGDIQPYDPERHVWVGAGAPPPDVKLISPGFTSRGEEDRDVTLVPARVVAPA